VKQPRWARPIRVSAIAATAAAGFSGLVALLYLIGQRVYPGTSDGATIILQGQAIAHGNLLLSRWVLTLDSYWLSESLLSALVSGPLGLHPQLLNLEPAVSVALFTCAAMLVAASTGAGAGVTRRARLVGAATVLALVVFATPTFQQFALSGAWHVSTALFALGAFVALRTGRFDWRWVLGVVCLVAGLLSDLELVAYAVIPLACAAAVAALRDRDWRTLVPPIAAGAASVAGFEVCRAVATTLGGFRTVKPLPVVLGSRTLYNFGTFAHYGAEFLGWAPSSTTASSLPPDAAARVLTWAHAATGAFIVFAVALALVNMVRGVARARRQARPGSSAAGAAGAVAASSDVSTALPLDELLFFATVGAAATFIFQSQSGQVSDARYLTAATLFAITIAGRTTAAYLPKIAGLAPHIRRAVATGAIALALIFTAVLADGLSAPAAGTPARMLANWLAAHHLDNGIGDYWAASLTTLESSGQVVVRPVSASPDGKLHANGALIDADWYSGQRFEFLVLKDPSFDNVTMAAARRTFGTPAHIYHLGIYHVLVWAGPIGVPRPARPA
jgi:hypothetical protein